MTLTPARHDDARRLLPLTPTTRHGSRSHLTCLHRCGNACDQPVPNTSDNPEFRAVAERSCGGGALYACSRAAASRVSGGVGGHLVVGVVPGSGAGRGGGELVAGDVNRQGCVGVLINEWW
jgi:hypothetical protein